MEADSEKALKNIKKRRACSTAVIDHLEAMAKAQRLRKKAPSALDPVMAEATPVQETKGESPKKRKLKRLLQLSTLAMMSHPFGAQLASWTAGVAADCGAEWTREAVELAVARGPHPTAVAPDAVALVHEDIECQVKAGLTETTC